MNALNSYIILQREGGQENGNDKLSFEPIKRRCFSRNLIVL